VPKEKLMLIDGNALVHRAYHALPPLTGPSGEPTNATFGFTSMLLKALNELRPTHVVVAFDVGRTFRHERYAEYKANRARMDEELAVQFESVRRVVDALGIARCGVPGYEADDLLGTLARQAHERGMETLIVTGDSDTLQLVRPDVRVLTPGRTFSDTKLYDVQAVEERYGLRPEQLIDYKALVGDSSDNVPGVPGIGQKTATQLLQQFGSIEGIYAHLDEVRGARTRAALEEHRAQVLESRTLVTIVTDVPLPVDVAVAQFGGYQRDDVMGLFRELGFRSLVDRLPAPRPQQVGGSGGTPPPRPPQLVGEAGEGTPQQVEGTPQQVGESGTGAQLTLFPAAGAVPVFVQAHGEYQAVRSEAALAALVERLWGAETLAVDVETTGVDAVRAGLVGIALSDAPGRGYYVPIGHDPEAATGAGSLAGASGAGFPARLPSDGADAAVGAGRAGWKARPTGSEAGTSVCQDGRTGWKACPTGQVSLEAARRLLGPLLAAERPAKTAHNAKFDLTVLAQHGFAVGGLEWDTMLAAWLVNPAGRNLGLKGLAWEKLGLEMTPIDALIGKGREQITMAQVPVERVAPYASADVDITLRLRELLAGELQERAQERLFHEIEMPLVPVLVDMERRGVALDVRVLDEMSRDLYRRLSELEGEIYRAAGHSFNVNSTQQLGVVLYDELGLKPPRQSLRRTQSGRSTDASVLEALRGRHEIIALIQEYRQLIKLKNTYVDALPLLVNPRTGRVHTSFNQTAVVTGRLSSSDPNLQNIPIRTELGSQIRRAFVAGPGTLLLAADYSQVELRILAHMAGDEAMLAAFGRGEDIHARTAALIHGVSLERVTPDMRRVAKAINFGLVYGMSDYGLAARTELSQEEAAHFIRSYFAQFPAVQTYLEETKRQAREQGYVETLFGRRRYFPELAPGSKVPIGMRRAAERMAINMPIQGTAADIVKIAMVRLHRELAARGLRAGMTLQVHDELVLEVPEDELAEVRPLLQTVMEGAAELRAPLRVDIEVGQNWLEMR